MTSNTDLLAVAKRRLYGNYKPAPFVLARGHEADAVVGEAHALADVPRHVGAPRVHVVREARLGHHLRDGGHQLRQPDPSRAPLGVVAGLDAGDPLPLTDDVHRAVLGDRAVDGPLPDDDLTPPAGPAGDGHQAEPGVAEIPQRAVGLAREDAVGEERVVEIEEEAPQRARLARVERRERPQRGLTRAISALR
jgi:hypothetical protein